MRDLKNIQNQFYIHSVDIIYKVQLFGSALRVNRVII